MTAVATQSVVPRPFPPVKLPRGSRFLGYLSTTDPKRLGVMYIVTSFVFFMVGGVLALLMRAEPARPGLQFLSPEQYNQLFTMHGTIMLLFYATPVVFGFANYVLPLQIGTPDVAFPRLNALSYWLYVSRSRPYRSLNSGNARPETACSFIASPVPTPRMTRPGLRQPRWRRFGR